MDQMYYMKIKFGKVISFIKLQFFKVKYKWI